MPLEELLQWLDQSARTGVVTILRPDGFETWIAVRDRHVVAASAAVLEGALAGGSETERAAAAFECVLDLFLLKGARFRFEAVAGVPSAGIPLDHPLGFVLMEGLRQLDEWANLDAAYPDEGARLGRTGAGSHGTPTGDAILELVDLQLTVGDARIRLGLSRAAMLRRLHELTQRGLVSVDGRTLGADPVAALLAQAATLLGEGQYAEASLVFRALLASDPLDSRARLLLARAERLEVEALSRALPADAMVRPGKAGTALGHAAGVLDLVDEGRPVVYLVAASPLREVETLRILAQLRKTGHVRLDAPIPRSRPRARKAAS